MGSGWGKSGLTSTFSGKFQSESLWRRSWWILPAVSRTGCQTAPPDRQPSLSAWPSSPPWGRRPGWRCRRRWWSGWRTTRFPQLFLWRRPEGAIISIVGMKLTRLAHLLSFASLLDNLQHIDNNVVDKINNMNTVHWTATYLQPLDLDLSLAAWGCQLQTRNCNNVIITKLIINSDILGYSHKHCHSNTSEQTYSRVWSHFEQQIQCQHMGVDWPTRAEKIWW